MLRKGDTRMQAIRDGHIHTPLCPHGTKDSLDEYVQEAIRLGRREISFTEHFPIPKGIISDELRRECNLLPEELDTYVEMITAIKQKYQSSDIKINLGFEVDYLEGYDNETKTLLDKYGKYIDDSILSVHFVKYNGEFVAVDFLEDLERYLGKTLTIEELYELYFDTVIKSVDAQLGKYKPNRIGHPTLVRRFNKLYPYPNYEHILEDKARTLVNKIKQAGMEVDYNFAGLVKEYCDETYPQGKILEMMKEAGITLVPGSDSHAVKQLKIIL